MKVPSVDVTNCLTADSVYFVRVLFSFSSTDIDVRINGSVVGCELNGVAVAFGVVRSAAGVVHLSVDVFQIYTSLRTMFLK